MLSRQLSWSHFGALLPLNQQFQREFYAEMCRIEGWSGRTVRESIDSMLYERTALSKHPAALVQQELASLGSRDDVTPSFILKGPLCLGLPWAVRSLPGARPRGSDSAGG